MCCKCLLKNIKENIQQFPNRNSVIREENNNIFHGVNWRSFGEVIRKKKNLQKKEEKKNEIKKQQNIEVYGMYRFVCEKKERKFVVVYLNNVCKCV